MRYILALILFMILVDCSPSDYKGKNEEQIESSQQSTVFEDSVAIIKLLEEFNNAVKEGNRDRAEKFLADNFLVLESGNIEYKREYLFGHFYSDGKYFKSTYRTIKERDFRIEDNIAWIGTITEVFKSADQQDEPISNSLESIVLVKDENTGLWKINMVHWSASSHSH